MSTSPAAGQFPSLVSQYAGHVAQPSGICRTSILVEISDARASSFHRQDLHVDMVVVLRVTLDADAVPAGAAAR